MQVFWGNSESEVEELVENNEAVQFCGWNNLLEGNSNICQFSVSPFEDGIVEIFGKEDWFAGEGSFCKIEDSVVLAPEKFVLGAVGFLLVWFAPILIESSAFRISIGSSIVVLGSVILLTFFLARAIPGRRMGIGLALLGGFTYTIVRYLLYWTLDSFISLMENPIFIGYVILSALIGAAVTYYFDRPEDVKLNRIFRSALQLFGLFLMYHSTSMRIASILLCGIVVALKMWAPTIEVEQIKNVLLPLKFEEEEEEEEDREVYRNYKQASKETNGLEYLKQQEMPYISPPGWKPHNMQVNQHQHQQQLQPPIQQLPRKRPAAQQQTAAFGRLELDNSGWLQNEDIFRTPGGQNKPFSFRREDRRQPYGNNNVNWQQQQQQLPYQFQQHVNLNEGAGCSQEAFPTNSFADQDFTTPVKQTNSHGIHMSPSTSGTRIRREKLRFGETSGFVQGVEIAEKEQTQSQTLNQGVENLGLSGASLFSTPIHNIRKSQRVAQEDIAEIQPANIQNRNPEFGDLNVQQKENVGSGIQSSSRRSRQTRSHGMSHMSSSPTTVKYTNMDSGRGVNKDGPTYRKLVSQGYVVDHENKTISHP